MISCSVSIIDSINCTMMAILAEHVCIVIHYCYTVLGLSLLCQHNFEHNRVAKVLSVMRQMIATIINKICIKHIFSTVCEIMVNV